MNNKRLYSTVLVMLLCGLFFSQRPNAQIASETTAAQQAPLSAEKLAAAEKKLLGKHMFSLQWISWDKLGTAVVKRGTQGLEIEAKQALNGDFVTLNGTIEIIDERAFNFTGKIVTKVHHINQGVACQREGTFEFRATGKRKYWRMQQIDNPCDQVVDYIDVYFSH
ncbi:hypothetical protein [Glaesserella sp.]|uniref:hypothetical protein n=1 Tax=Glaesserella sp. TaxID=2094731 RepID=UPI00359FEA4E